MGAWCDGCMVCQRKRARIWACMYTIAFLFVSRRLTLHTHQHSPTLMHSCMQETHTAYTHTQKYTYTPGIHVVDLQYTDRQKDRHTHTPTQTWHAGDPHCTKTHTYTHTHTHKHPHPHPHTLHASRRLIKHTHTHTHRYTHVHTVGTYAEEHILSLAHLACM